MEGSRGGRRGSRFGMLSGWITHGHSGVQEYEGALVVSRAEPRILNSVPPALVKPSFRPLNHRQIAAAIRTLGFDSPMEWLW